MWKKHEYRFNFHLIAQKIGKCFRWNVHKRHKRLNSTFMSLQEIANYENDILQERT